MRGFFLGTLIVACGVVVGSLVWAKLQKRIAAAEAQKAFQENPGTGYGGLHQQAV